MKEAQTLQEALNAALNDAQAWKAAALAAQAERDALAAQVHAVRSAWVAIGNWPDTVEDKKLIANAICATSDQCLAEIRTEAVLRFAGSVLAKYRYDITEWAKIEADEIRKGGAK